VTIIDKGLGADWLKKNGFVISGEEGGKKYRRGGKRNEGPGSLIRKKGSRAGFELANSNRQTPSKG